MMESKKERKASRKKLHVKCRGNREQRKLLTCVLLKHIGKNGYDFGVWTREQIVDFARVVGNLLGHFDDTDIYEALIDSYLDEIPPQRWAEFLGQVPPRNKKGQLP